jgi:hypothetical protein
MIDEKHAMRLLSTLIASILLISCGSSDESRSDQNAPAKAEAPEDTRVMCALNGAKRFERKCLPQWTESDEGRVLVLRAPDGGFRRLLLTGDGRGFVAADGAEPAEIGRYDDKLIQVTIGEDRYRLPAHFEEIGP